MPPPGFNKAPDKDPYITLGFTQEASEDEYASLLGRPYLYLHPEGGDISLLSEEESLTGGDLYPPGDASLRDSIATGKTSALKAKQDT